MDRSLMDEYDADELHAAFRRNIEEALAKAMPVISMLTETQQRTRALDNASGAMSRLVGEPCIARFDGRGQIAVSWPVLVPGCAGWSARGLGGAPPV